MDDKKFLKILIITAGTLELPVGTAFIFIDFIFAILGITGYNLVFPEIAGIYIIVAGIMLLLISRDIEKNLNFLIAYVLMHFVLIYPAIQYMILVPQFSLLFLATLIVDPIWAALVLIFLIRCNYILRDAK